MVNAFACQILFRVVLPFVLLTSVLFRFNAFSFIYLLLLLASPLIPSPSRTTVHSGKTGYYLKAVVGCSAAFCLSQVVYQTVLLSLGSYSTFPASPCGWPVKLLYFIGLHRVNNIKIVDALRLIVLDFFVLLSSIVVLVLCEKIPEEVEPENRLDLGPRDIGLRSETGVTGGSVSGKRRRRASEFLLLLGEFCVLMFMAAAGILHPSLICLVYFISFLSVATWLGTSRKLGSIYYKGRIGLALYSALHFLVLYLYQFDFSQEYIDPESLSSRLIGLTPLRIPRCNSTGAYVEDIRTLEFRTVSWTLYVSPLAVLALYTMLCTMTRYLVFHPNLELQAIRSPEIEVPKLDSRRSSRKSSMSWKRKHSKIRRDTGDFQDDSFELAEMYILCLPVRRKRCSTSEYAPLLDNDHIGKTYQTLDKGGQKNMLSPDPNGSIVWSSVTDMPDDGQAEEAVTVASGEQSRLRQILLLLSQGFKLLTKGSYVITLIIMMAWSITYHSWLTFVLLLWSCMLWMMPNSRIACLRSSPFLVAYAEALLLLQYLYSLELNDSELPQQIERVNLAQVGLVKQYHQSYQSLAVKILYTVMFWITLRQYVEMKREKRVSDIAEGVMMEPFHISYSTAQPGIPRPELKRQMSIATTVGAGTSPFIRKVGHYLKKRLTKYWIWVVASMLMVISLGGTEVVLYRIAYMFLFLFFILMFQFSYNLWIQVMYGFWLTVIIYSMLVLILIYTYQFENFPNYWEEYLFVPKEFQKDIGLEVYKSDPGTLFIKLLTPTFFLIITIIQLHYFHKDFIRLNDVNYREKDDQSDVSARHHKRSQIVSPEEVQVKIKRTGRYELPPAPPGTPAPVRSHTNVTEDASEGVYHHRFKATRFHDLMDNATVFYNYLCEFLWRVLEIHIGKIVVFSVFSLSVYDVCAIHILFIFLVVAALPFKSLQVFLTHCCSVWASILLISKMIYQLNFVDRYGWSTNCSTVIGAPVNQSELPYPFNDTIDNRIWIGFKKTDNLTDYCKGYIGLIVVFSIQAIVRIRQKFYRLQNNISDLKPGVVFPNVTRSMADEGLWECLQYLTNYFFYKFGVEFCFVTMVACIGVRLDVFAVLTAIWLSVMFLLRRKSLARVWPFYVAYLCIVLPLQYLMAVGLPAGLCVEYPWYLPETREVRELAEWLFLPDYINPPIAYKILVDFFQLIFACCQLAVFAIESSPNHENYEGGSNKEIYQKNGSFCGETPNPVPDFVTYAKSYLSMVKVFVFFSFYWVTLAVMFLAGTYRVSLFAMGYVLGCFFFLWNGNEFYLKPMKVLLKMWNCLLAYNVIVILIKCILQVVGCVFLPKLSLNFCWVVQLFGIACLKKLRSDMNIYTKGDTIQECKVPTDEAGLLWDGICFGFLLLQKRLFCSYYFHHLIIEILAQQSLASRGAEMIHEIQMKEVQEQMAEEREIMEKIKMKMDKIRANQQKMRVGEYAEPETHFQAIRSGDYYLFEDEPPADIELDLVDSRPRKSLMLDDEDADVKVKGLNALLSSAMKGGIRGPQGETGARKVSEEADDVGDSSCLSPIISVDRSPVSRTISGSSQAAKSQKTGSPTNERASTSAATSSQAQLPISPAKSAGRPPSEDERDTVKADTEEPPVHPASQAEAPKEPFSKKVKQYMKFSIALMNSLLLSATAKLNSISRDYRYVARQLSHEKRRLKDEFVTGLATTLGEATVRDSAFHFHEHSREFRPQLASAKGSHELLLNDTGDLVLDSPDVFDQHRHKTQPTVIRFIVALYYAILSRSEVVCYLVIMVNQMKSASLLSLPLPLMAFLWGSLSVPRPTKTFWITVITYTEAIVVVKYLFQFNFFPWNDDTHFKKPFWPPRIIGIEKKDNYAVYDLVLLLLVFFHRFMLKGLGLWKDTDRASASITPDALLDKQEVTSLGTGATVVSVGGTLQRKAPSVSRFDDLSSYGSQRMNYMDSMPDMDESMFQLSKLFAGIHNYIEPFKSFFSNLLHPAYRVTTDVYAYIFLCDFVNFLITVFGYWAFGTGGSEDGVTSYFQENKVPIPFLIMLLAQFALIVIDRALYLRKFILGKLIFQIILVIFIHVWMFFILPALADREFGDKLNLPPKLWYIVKCIYLLLSAYQIRSGYPTRILGNIFTKKYNYINFFLFKGYMLVPFLYELRSLMDWIWTDTSMNLNNWLKMEDIFTNVFLLKCQRRAEDDYPTPRGSKRKSLVKYGLGGVLLFAVIIIIWFPLLLFALGNTVGKAVHPYDCTVELSIGGFEPIFKISAQQKYLERITKQDYDSLLFKFKSSAAQAFLANYDENDITRVLLNGNSTAVWSISPPSQEALINELRGSNNINLRLAWSFTRNIETNEAEKTVSNEYVMNLKDVEVRTTLGRMLSGDTNLSVIIPHIFPQYIKVPRKGKSEIVKVLEASSDDHEGYMKNLNLRLRTGSFKNLTSFSEWWEIQETCNTTTSSGDNECTFLRIIAFSDKVFPGELSLLTGYGIIGLYTTFVLVASRVMRGVMSGMSFVIMYDDMPNVDRVLQLCLDIYLVRESGELTLEEDLFAKLIFLYRSPETLIKWTRNPEEPRQSHPT